MEAILVLRKLGGLMVAQRRDEKGDIRVLMQNHGSAHPGVDRGSVARRAWGPTED